MSESLTSNHQSMPIEAERSAATFILQHFEHMRCDSDGVADCVRCNSVALAHWMLKRLAVETSVSFVTVEQFNDLADERDGLRAALKPLLEQWAAFKESPGNQESAYYILAKYLWNDWEKAASAMRVTDETKGG